MKPCLVDVNLLLALLVRSHSHHKLVRKWYDGAEAGEAGMCRLVQLGLVRLLCNRNVMGVDAVTLGEAWDLVSQLLEDERVEFLPEPDGLDSILRSLLQRRPGGQNVVSDAYLAAFAMAGSHRLVTLDGGFRKFRGLDLLLLG